MLGDIGKCEVARGCLRTQKLVLTGSGGQGLWSYTRRGNCNYGELESKFENVQPTTISIPAHFFSNGHGMAYLHKVHNRR